MTTNNHENFIRCCWFCGRSGCSTCGKLRWRPPWMKWRLSSSKWQLSISHQTLYGEPRFLSCVLSTMKWCESCKESWKKIRLLKVEACLKMQYVDFCNCLMTNRLHSQASPQMTAQCCIPQVKHWVDDFYLHPFFTNRHSLATQSSLDSRESKNLEHPILPREIWSSFFCWFV